MRAPWRSRAPVNSPQCSLRHVPRRHPCNRQHSRGHPARPKSSCKPPAAPRRLQAQAQGSTAVADAPAQGTEASPLSAAPARPRVLIIGTGWGAISMIKALPKNIATSYDISVVSPRSYFLFTALLPAAAFGSVETRSIVESARKLLEGKGSYYEAAVQQIDVKARKIKACFPAHAGLDKHCFELPYDILVHSVGSVNNSFGIKGVMEHCFTFKSIEDAVDLRQRVCECFERAALPDISDKERDKLLTFITVGGGPTGVEVAAEMHDVIDCELRRYYPHLVKKHARVLLVELSDHILSSYDRQIASYASQEFSRSGIDLILNSRVCAVDSGSLTIEGPDKQRKRLEFGACLWATGVAMHPLTRQLVDQLPGQDNFRSVICDSHLHVLGADLGSIYALGDAATIAQPRALARAQELFDEADTNGDGVLQLEELRGILRKASKEFTHLEEHSQFLDRRYGGKRWGGFVLDKLRTGNVAPKGGTSSPCDSLNDQQPVTRQQFEELLETMDKGLRALPATGTVAGQEGKYLASLFASKAVQPDKPLPASAKPFRFQLSSNVAYIGGDQAVMDVPKWGIFKGKSAGVMWRGFEVYRQISFRNQLLVITDWMKSKTFGRDIEAADMRGVAEQ